jgi:hypothetical protein
VIELVLFDIEPIELSVKRGLHWAAWLFVRTQLLLACAIEAQLLKHERTFLFCFYVVDYAPGPPATFTIFSESTVFDQPVRVRKKDDSAENGQLIPGDIGYLFETNEEVVEVIDEFGYLDNVTIGGKAGLMVQIDNAAGTEDEYYLYMESFLSNVEQDDLIGYSVSSTSYVYCLLAGTKIETARGIFHVEDLIPGDQVKTLNDYSTVRWVGVQTLSPIFAGKASWPVKISKGALGENSPNQDLYVSQDHAIFFEGLSNCHYQTHQNLCCQSRFWFPPQPSIDVGYHCLEFSTKQHQACVNQKLLYLERKPFCYLHQ